MGDGGANGATWTRGGGAVLGLCMDNGSTWEPTGDSGAGGGGATTDAGTVTHVNSITDDFGVGASSQTASDYSLYLDEAVASIALKGSAPSLLSTTTIAITSPDGDITINASAGTNRDVEIVSDLWGVAAGAIPAVSDGGMREGHGGAQGDS